MKTIAEEIERAKVEILGSIVIPLTRAGITATHHNINGCAASVCIEDDAQREKAAEMLRADGWKVISTHLYGRDALVIC